MKRTSLGLGLVGMVVGGLLLAGCGAAQTPVAAAQEKPVSGITVAGEGKALAAPDVAYINLGVETTGSTAKQAMDENASRMSQVVERIKALGVQERDIQTSGVNLHPVYEQKRVDMPNMPVPPDQSLPVIIGYRASNQVRISVYDLKRAPEVLDGVVAVGANSVSNLQFGIKDDAKLRQQALAEAARQTRDKAQVIADALGVKITSIASVHEETYGVPMPAAEVSRAGMAADSATPVMPGELTVMARVIVTFNFQ